MVVHERAVLVVNRGDILFAVTCRSRPRSNRANFLYHIRETSDRITSGHVVFNSHCDMYIKLVALHDCP